MAQWICRCLQSCCPGLTPKHTFYAFIICSQICSTFVLVLWKEWKWTKRGRVWPICNTSLEGGEGGGRMAERFKGCYESSLSIWKKFEPTLANLMCFWANFHCVKWPNIEKWAWHLVTLIVSLLPSPLDHGTVNQPSWHISSVKLFTNVTSLHFQSLPTVVISVSSPESNLNIFQ